MLIFANPGSYEWDVPAGVDKVKAAVLVTGVDSAAQSFDGLGSKNVSVTISGRGKETRATLSLSGVTLSVGDKDFYNPIAKTAGIAVVYW